jgi:2-amino-4-hydroxy-6-hydroxymethyldihydropteridine diphosphokinase
MSEKNFVRLAVSLGSNIEPRREYLDKALSCLSALPGTRFIAASEVVETEPVGVPEEYSNLKFLNRVAVFESNLSAAEFSRAMHEIEDALGRKRGPVRNVPRTIDIDLIDFGGLISDDPELTLPHPRWRERDFVREPLMALGYYSTVDFQKNTCKNFF